jgi:hypothetical protein
MTQALTFPLSLDERNSSASGAGTGTVTGGVRWILRAEGLALFVAATALYPHFGVGWGWFALLFLTPDLSFLAYLAGPRWGAVAYNSVHSTLLPLALGTLGLAMQSQTLEALALIVFAHVGLDRALGYGLKYSTAFGHAHLGWFGRDRS